ncbi:endonuclease NucS [Actinomyces sp. zg-332]|uniref:endonuclease NucS n=1 Tax=Actinomyces sp. zg-332 TaxID=2708340 RepID=UPI001423DCA7|nr:endonuclease NucS [Actinomyces sp. zg-332]QPK94507.1 endonuclease NucS [Actinomyces sp. zg-332]
MRVLVANCSVDYSGRLDAHLPLAKRVVMFKADGSVLVHCDGGSYKPLNWMSPPCKIEEVPLSEEDVQDAVEQVLQVVSSKSDDRLILRIHEVIDNIEVDLGEDPGLIKDGVEAHLQKLLAEQVEVLGSGFSLVRREYPTPIGPVDLLVRDENSSYVAVEVKRRGEIDGVEQLTRYLELLNRDPKLAPITGIFAAQEIRPQARTLAQDRGIRCVILDYQAMRGIDDSEGKLF